MSPSSLSDADLAWGSRVQSCLGIPVAEGFGGVGVISLASQEEGRASKPPAFRLALGCRAGGERIQGCKVRRRNPGFRVYSLGFDSSKWVWGCVSEFECFRMCNYARMF